jgi:hypothetical protein
VANRGSQTVVEFAGRVLSSAGVSIPAIAATNSSPDLNGPLGITFDSSNNQWVGNRDGNTLTEFKLSTLRNLAINPAPPADIVISDDGSGAFVHTPQLITFRKRNLWVANYRSGIAPGEGNGFITEYLATQLTSSGSPVPAVTQVDTADFRGPDGINFDSSGNLFVADFDAGKVWVFKAATVAGWSGIGVDTPSDANLSDASSLQPTSVALDRSGNLWVADCEAEAGGEIYMFPKSSLTTTTSSAATVFTAAPIATPNGSDQTLNCPGAIAFDKDGNLWYTNFISNAGAAGAVGEFARAQLATGGSSSPTPRIFLEGDTGRTVLDSPEGLAFGPAS